MMQFETYQHNLDVKNKFGIASVNIDKSVNYRGHIDLINKNCENDVSETKRPPLGAAVVGLNNTDVPLPKDIKFYNAWSDVDAQELYLSSKPTCFLILGKPGVALYTLGEAVAKKLNCIHICPRNVIMDELDQKCSTGRCMDFNLRHNKVCKYDTIFPIIKEKLLSPAVQHRGYVMSGIPLVNTSWDERYLIEGLNGEESILEIDDLLYDILLNLKKRKKQKKDDDTVTSLSSKVEAEGEKEEEAEEEQEPEEGGEEEEEPRVELPKYLLEPCSNIINKETAYMTTKKVVLLEQFKQMMNLSMKPDIIIYITCPDADVVSQKEHTYVNYVNGSTVNESFPSRISADLRWPIKCDMNIDYVSRQDSFNSKYNCRQPMNFKANATQQMCNFRNHVLPFMERELEKLEPTTVIRLDGRITVYQMLQQISERLLLLPIKKVCIPEPMYLEEHSDDLDEFWQTVQELSVIRSDNISFNRYASPWFNRCPVELKKRLSIRGKPKFAVTFLKHVYLMATLPSMIQFCRNPRPFLKITCLMPTCRAVIMGTRSSGKTMISKCLEWIFDATYIDYSTFYAQEKVKKRESIEKNIFSEISATIEDSRYALWQAAELQRMTNLNDWYEETIKKLKKYLPLLNQYLMQSKCSCVEQEDVEDEQKPEPTIDPDLLKKFRNSRNELLTLPILNDVEEIRHAMADKDTLIRLAPDDLVTPIVKPAIPVLGDVDVTTAINAYIITNDVQKDLEPTPDQLMANMFKVLEDIDKNAAHDTDNEEQYGKWVIDGFPTDLEVWGILLSSIYMPDYTIALIENREIDIELLRAYQIIQQSVKHYEERFLLAKDPLIKTKLLAKKPSDSKPLDVKIILHEHESKVLDTIFDVGHEQVPDASDLSAEVTAFTEAVDKFKEEWPDVQNKIQDCQKCHILLELENKTDVAIIEEMLLKLRQCYCVPCVPGEPEEPENIEEDEDNPRDMLTFNLPHFLCETSVYCPIAYYDYGVLWEGKPEFSIKYNNRLHLFSNENNLNEKFCKDVTKYQSYSKPFKHIPCLRICVMGCIGSGKTTISKFIAKELGLIHVDFVELINDYLMPRHFKKIGRKYENSFTNSPIEEENAVEMQMGEENLESLEADLLSNETELRRMINNYFEQGLPLMSIFMQKLLKKIWFQKPFSTTGFVLDGFPRMLSDVEDMVTCFCIPDLIVDLSSSSDIVLARTGAQMFKTWKTQITEAKYVAKRKFENEKSKWFSFVSQRVVCKLLLEEILNRAVGGDEPVKPASTESHKMDIDIADAPESDVAAVYNEFVKEFPEPVDLLNWENANDARERIDTRIEGIYESDEGNIEGLRELISEHKIKTIDIDNTKSLNKTLRMVSAKLTHVRNRNGSLLEQTFILDSDVAESLLQQGFYFFSKFNRMCPVHMFENPNCIFNPYMVMKSKDMIYTVAHRSYIYFIGGQTNLEKFRFDPLKYIVNDNIIHFKQYPLRFSVIGPPKSGKSTLALKLAKKYGLICISKGKAVRHVLDNMHWTELAKQMTVPLIEGNCIGTDLIIKSVQTVANDQRTVTNGCVFDGFPDSASEAMELLDIGLYPLIIFDLFSDKKTILENSQNEIFFDIIKYKPPYCRTFVEDRYTNWSRKCMNVRDWVKDEIQNLYVLNGNESRWHCLQDATLRIKSTCLGVYHYLNNVHSNVVPAGVMCVSNATFQKNMSAYKNLCPVCLSKNVLRHSEFPVDKKGIIQFKHLYYWVCLEHMNLVLNNPEHYLASKNVEIPEIPAIIKRVNPSLVYESGICIVCYAENLPAQNIERSTGEFAASYQGNTYLFCSADCQKKFLAKPQLYYNIVIFKDAKLFPELSLKKLPHIGYLEQTLGDVITEACCSLNVLRPKYPGLDIQLSGLLYIALYLKTHNVRMNKVFLPKYMKALITYEARSRRVPVPDERYDFLCEYHKPASKVPAFLNVVDIAGLVKGAAEGQGLGNAFLSHIKACDAIFNLCRAFDDEDVIHVDGEVNPVRDLETIGEELRLKDEEQLMASLDKLERVVNRGADKKLKPEYDALLRIKAVLVDEKKHIRFGDWSAADIEILNRYLFITSKPALYLVNLSEKDYIRKKNKWLPKLKEWIDKNDPGAPLVPFSGVLETKLMDMDPEERKAYLKEHNITSALDKIIVQGYKALQLEYFFTAGPDEVKAWIIQKGTKAPQAAGRIHTDFEKGFIMAEVMHYKDFKEEGSEAACKSAGKYRQQGRNYVVEDGDIIFFKFNAGAGLKDAKKK